MAGRKAFDFIKIGAQLPKAVKGEFGVLRSSFEASSSAMNALPSALESIDWDSYKAKVGDPSLVDAFKAQYAGLTIPYPVDTKSAGINAQQAEFKTEMAEYLTGSEERIAKFSASLAALHAEKPLADMTVEEYLADKPELRASIIAEMDALKL